MSEAPAAHDRPRSPRLADLCGGRDNNLNLIRVLAASAVAVSHSFPMTRGKEALEPLEALTGHSLGWLAVAIFFVISGFLIARSYDRRVTRWHWLLARIMRLFPALIVVLSLTAFVLGPLVTALPPGAYWTAYGTWSYVPRNLSLAILQYPLPGVFADNPYPGAINGSLWTLVYEVTCYGGVFVAGLAGTLRRPRWFALGMLALAVWYVLVVEFGVRFGLAGRADPLARLVFPFALGMSAYVWRDRVRLDGWWLAGIWAVAIAAWFTPVFSEVYVAAVAYSVLVAAYRPKGVLLRYNRLGDYSYGIYIYAGPMQQLAVHLWPGQDWRVNLALALPATLLCAVLSWHLVERRALALAKPAAAWRTGLWQRQKRGVVGPG